MYVNVMEDEDVWEKKQKSKILYRMEQGGAGGEEIDDTLPKNAN